MRRAFYGASRIAVALVLIAYMLVGIQTNVTAAPSGLPSGFSATTLINHSMTAPSSVRVAPDGRIFVFDLTGSIKIFKSQSGSFNAALFGTVAVNATGDRGLLGATFDRDFTNHPYVYIHYVGTDDKVRIGRYNASGDTGTNFSVIYTAPVTAGFQHAGGGITSDASGKLLFGIGDSGTPTNSQDLTKIAGKIHRINRDGSVPANPFAGQVGVADTVYAYGVRNPFRLTTDKQTGTVYLGDVGFNTWEEVNVITAGKNYGWATQEGPCTSSCPYENPVYWYAHQFGTSNTNDASIVAGPVYRGNAYPASYQGKMFVSDYVQGFIRTITPTVASDSYNTFSTSNGTVIDMDVGPDGKLYFVTINSPTLYRLDYSGGAVNAPPVAIASANTAAGSAPLAVSFSSAGSSDPEGAPFSYLWNFGDGTTSTQANPSKTYNNNGQYTVSLTVSDGVNSTPASTLTVKVGNQPTVTITSPTPTFTYTGGQTIAYAATAISGSGVPLPDSALTTTVRLYHSDHSHPFVGPLVGGNGQITAPTDGELSPDVWLRITVEATDSSTGVTGSSYVEIQPKKAQITVNTSPAGLNVVLDGSNHVIPPTVQGVVGMTRQIAAPSPQIFMGQQYVFDHWSDGGAQNHSFAFSANNTTYTAYYVAVSGGTVLSNVLANSSFEDGSGAVPTDWFFSRWGTNNIAYSHSTDAHTGSRSAKMQATTLTSGEGRLFHKAAALESNKVHNVQYFYTSDVQVKAVADVTLNNGSHSYIWLGISQPSTAWNEQNWTFTTPADTKNVVINLYLTSVGYVQVDDFTLLAPTLQVPPTVVAPTITLAANPNTITTGQNTMLDWSVTGTTPTCIATGAWSGPQAVVGTHQVSPAGTSTYTLTCTNSMGSDTKSVTVTVLPVAAPGNVVPNSSVEEHDAQDKPLSWRATKWGTNTSVLEHVHGAAYNQDHSLRATMTSRISGEAGWSFSAQSVQPSTQYTFAQYAKSSGPTKVLVDITNTNNTHTYLWLGTLPTTTNWTLFKKTFTTPANTAKISIGTYMTGVGSFDIDQISLTPPMTTPVVTITASPNTLTLGESSQLTWSTNDPLAVCTASGVWGGAQATSGTLTITPTSTSTYMLSCANSAGTGNAQATVTVNPSVPQTSTNLLTNASEFTVPQGALLPEGWYTGSWGDTTISMLKQTVGRTDNASLAIVLSNYISGDAKWYFEPVNITGGLSYSYSDYYKSTVETELVAAFTLSDTTKTYQWLGSVSAAADWTKVTKTIAAPIDATQITVHHVLKQNGTLELDDFSLSSL